MKHREGNVTTAALRILSGVVEAADYRGDVAPRAYSPVELLGWGVAKIKKSEMRAFPMIAAEDSFFLGGVAIFAGLVTLRKRINPLIQRPHHNAKKSHKASAELTGPKRATKEHAIVTTTNASRTTAYRERKGL